MLPLPRASGLHQVEAPFWTHTSVETHILDTHFVGRVAALVTLLQTSLTTRFALTFRNASLPRFHKLLCASTSRPGTVFFTRKFASALDPFFSAVDVVMTYSAGLVSRPHRDMASASHTGEIWDQDSRARPLRRLGRWGAFAVPSSVRTNVGRATAAPVPPARPANAGPASYNSASEASELCN